MVEVQNGGIQRAPCPLFFFLQLNGALSKLYAYFWEKMKF